MRLSVKMEVHVDNEEMEKIISQVLSEKSEFFEQIFNELVEYEHDKRLSGSLADLSLIEEDDLFKEVKLSMDLPDLLEIESQDYLAHGTEQGEQGAQAPQPKRTTKAKKRSPTKRHKVRGPKLWEFLIGLLMDPKSNPRLIRWTDTVQGLFLLEEPEVVARLWGKAKNNIRMNYEKMSRCIRYYYKSKVFMPVNGKYTYRIGEFIREKMEKSEQDSKSE